MMLAPLWSRSRSLTRISPYISLRTNRANITSFKPVREDLSRLSLLSNTQSNQIKRSFVVGISTPIDTQSKDLGKAVNPESLQKDSTVEKLVLEDVLTAPLKQNEPISKVLPYADKRAVNEGPLTLKELISIYSSLSKVGLSSFVVLTTVLGFVMAPGAFIPSVFVYSTTGTALAIACANTMNQIIEIDRDSIMNRTLRRSLPSGRISPYHAAAFGLTCGAVGVSMLYFQVNGLAAALAFSNIILYTCIYTPLKRIHPVNTWVGSVVGAIPPMIGWASVTGGLEAGAWALGALLYVWQIPHFMALSWGHKEDYAKAGYKMLSNVNPEKVPAATLRWSLYLLPMGALCVASGITTLPFAFDSILVDSYLLYTSYLFYKDKSFTSARKAFFASLSYLLIFMGLMIFHKTSPAIEEDKKNEKEILQIE